MPEKVIKIPKSPAACADLLYSTREARYKLQHEINKMQDVEAALNEFFINQLPKDSTGIAGRVARIQITQSAKPVVEDWDKFYSHLKKTGEFELMQRRVSEGAVQERWDSKKQIPGVGRMQVKKVSCTKLK
jgi:hypothetical protein